jgi:hypothetical protein
MKKNQLSKIALTASLALVSVVSGFSQSTLGAACGCPPVADRPTVLLSSLPGFTVVANANGGELTSGATLSCDKTYIMDQKIYVPSGQTLTIEPGTVVKGRVAPALTSALTVGTTTFPVGTPDPTKAAALVIERGGKIIASGTENCQIVFTAEADPLDGSYPIANKGMWGGVVILGKATNNLTLAANGPFVAGGAGKLAVANGLGTIEGFATSVPQDQYGVNLTNGETFDDNDNSGILRFVSIRHSGAILSVGAEINGLTLGSVGRGTTIEHLEIVSCADDNIELFGGTVNVKYVSTLFGNDDMFDYDLGWTGKAQFIFGMKTDLTASADADNGIEADSDDQKSNLLPRTHPIIYNVTLLGNDKTTTTSDNSSIAAINAKELTEGEIYNSIFANFKNGLNLIKSLGTGRSYAAGGESWHNWSNNPSTATTPTSTTGNGTQSLKVKCNTFVGCTNPLTVANVAANATTADMTQFTTTDMNTIVTGNTLPGFDYTFAVNNTTNVFTTKNDVVPNPALSVSGCPTPPSDGFFSPAPYRGAFSSEAGTNWLSDWSYSQVLGATKGLVSCPTDLNGDGVTNIDDFLIFAPAFGTSCN